MLARLYTSFVKDDGQIRRLGGAFEHYFGPRGRKFEPSNLQMSALCPGHYFGNEYITMS